MFVSVAPFLKKKVECSYKVALVASLLKMSVVALGLWFTSGEKRKLREVTEILKD